MKRFVTCLFVFAALFAAAPVFTGCSDLSDDIDALEKRVSDLEYQLSELQKLVSASSSNLYITSVETISNGYVLHLSDGSSATVTNGSDGDSIFASVDLSDPNYVVINMTDGTKITLPTFEQEVSISIDGVNDGALVVTGGLPIAFSCNVNESDFSAILAEVKSTDGYSSAIATKASSAWKVEAAAPTFSEDGLTSSVTLATSHTPGDKAILTVSVILKSGKKIESSVIVECGTSEIYVLTFEGEYWNSLIDSKQYGGALLYGESGYGMSECDYYWSDPYTTLSSELVYNWGSYAYWNGGHAISNYVDGDLATANYTKQLSVYKKDAQLSQTGGGHNGSDNFCMHYGYKDNSGYSAETLPMFYFSDGEARVVDHMWVNNSTYAVSTYLEGNGLTAKISADDWVKIVATGTDAEGNTKDAEFYLCNGPENIITEWTKWDLSSLGAVISVEFNLTGSSDNGYGFSQPAYFAYDDVAIVCNLK